MKHASKTHGITRQKNTKIMVRYFMLWIFNSSHYKRIGHSFVSQMLPIWLQLSGFYNSDTYIHIRMLNPYSRSIIFRQIWIIWRKILCFQLRSIYGNIKPSFSYTTIVQHLSQRCKGIHHSFIVLQSLVTVFLNGQLGFTLKINLLEQYVKIMLPGFSILGCA